MSAVLNPNTARGLAVPTAGEIAGEKKMLLAFWVTGFVALAVGIAIGLLQSTNYAGINLYPYLQPFLKSYYQGLTMHGVLNAYVFTFFTISGWLMYLPARELKLKPNMGLAWFTYALMLLGTLMAAYGMFDNSSSVLYTMYPPLKGSAWFYLGITLVVVASIVPLFVVLEMRSRWKRANPGRPTPLVTYMSATTLLMWLLAALGAGTEAVFLLDPWSLGIVHTIDPLLARTLFWWTGHPIVYFWLMPGYISIYALLPRQAGGKLVSDPLARLAFLLLFVFSLPVGTHHQYTDPGISPVMKGIVTALTLSVAVPSLITAFTIALSLEYAGRRRGGKGLMGWWNALPWKDPSVAAQVLALVSFIFGGAGGIVNASWQLDNVVHNTLWIPAHFHLTVGTMTTLVFMGVSFWLLPHLTGRRLYKPGLALAGVWLWFLGLMTWGLAGHWAGLDGVPRRAWVSALPHDQYMQLYGAVHPALVIVGIGGALAALGAVLYYIVFFGTLFGQKDAKAMVEIPFTEFIAGSEGSLLTKVCEPLGLWTLITFVITLAVYIPVFWPMLMNPIHAPGFVLW
ncbi:cbb3-type cytochrome c oxidase subunit I [Thiomonas bhubaneswarensis]|uniref:Heme/copper-type cytochrome/quinol oxidase, subunit 1 n=1 Tax=Thiomonas bhubaneswarensis TaxID=339866 RepID=A0A0K6I7E3_9BURK|nr:cbb3-type cytochrome c oxidase subunit I [Thiomonas bhubaneswarensis]CUA98978.1 Heme/copper-type cytochrome/quinol oxidase, subunit 1 [Thiomonas bhubaneswarensis]